MPDYKPEDYEIIDKLREENPELDLYMRGAEEYIKLLERLQDDLGFIIKDKSAMLAKNQVMIESLAENVKELGGRLNDTTNDALKTRQADLDRGDAFMKNAEVFRKQAAQFKKAANNRGDTSRIKTASKHDRVLAEFTRLTDVEGLKEKAAIKQLQTWIDAENINPGGYDEPYLKKAILGIK